MVRSLGRLSRIPLARLAAACGLATAVAGSATVAQATLRDAQPNRIAIEYVPPQSEKYQATYKMLKDQHALETLRDVYSPFLLPEELTFRTKECGTMNAWYVREDGKPTITLCYDLLQHIMETVPKEATPEGITADDAKIGQFFWFASHEAGHALFDLYDVPVLGHEEDAADAFAAYIILHFGKDQSHKLINGAAWQWKEYVSDYRTNNHEVQIRLAGFALNHGQPEARFYDLMCMAYGADPKMFSDLTKNGYLPPTRAPSCRYEYRTFAYGFQKEIATHLDMDMAKQIWDMRWLPDPNTMAARGSPMDEKPPPMTAR
jgi:hypothetical protein